MISPLLALFNRSLRQDVRAKSTYWARAGLVGLMLVMMFTTHLSLGWSGAPGLAFFASATSANFFFIGLAGLSYFASAITEEKEEMTLGLLRMTNLNPLSILLGKSTSRLFGALLLLATQIPFTLLAVSFGGISIRQILAVYLALAAFIIFLSNLALLFSVMSARTAGAALKTGTVLFLFFVGPVLIPGIQWVLHEYSLIAASQPAPALASALAAWTRMSPLSRFAEVLSTGFTGELIGLQFWSNLALGLACFLIAWSVFELFCRDQKDAVPRRGFIFKRTSKLRLFAAGRPWRWALIWKDFNFVNGGLTAVIAKLLAYAFTGLAIVYIVDLNNTKWTWSGFGFTLMLCSALAGAIELAIISGRIFRQERRWKTLSSLATLPLTMRSIAYQKVAAALLAWLPVVIYFFIGLACATPEIVRSLQKWWEWKQKVGLDRALRVAIEWQAIGGMTFGFLLVIFGIHLVVMFSLRFKWGALPMAIAAVYAGSMFAVPLAFYMMGQAAFVGLITALVIGTGILHVRIGARLEELAAED